MIRENAIDAMNRMSENIMVSKLIYRNKLRRKSIKYINNHVF